jgi:hypothetical protein
MKITIYGWSTKQGYIRTVDHRDSNKSTCDGTQESYAASWWRLFVSFPLGASGYIHGAKTHCPDPPLPVRPIVVVLLILRVDGLAELAATVHVVTQEV